ncbi:MAG: hypothetical protein M3Z65_04150 [Chloroflexota bacterium]|nr:hypothetical protein [Chloroflexota bacterium]
MKLTGALLLGVVLVGCGSRADGPSTSSSPATVRAASSPATPTAPTPAKTPDRAGSDLFCGVLSDNTVTAGQGSGPNTFELRPATSVRTGSTGSARFGGWVTGRPTIGTYVCVWLAQGAPMGGFQSEVRPAEPGYSTEILPNGFALPQGCAFVGRPAAGTDGLSVVWKVDCGATANRSARGTLAPAFTAQGWTLCSSAVANALWRKGVLRLTVSEGSGAPGEYPMLTQRPDFDPKSTCP